MEKNIKRSKLDLVLSFLLTLIALILVEPIFTTLTPLFPFNISSLWQQIILSLGYIIVMVVFYKTNLLFNKNILKISLEWLLFLVLGGLIFVLLHNLVNNNLEIFGSLYSYNLDFQFNILNYNFAILLIVFLMFAIQTLAEEWVFRGWLLDNFTEIFGFQAGVIFSALLFGLAHIPNSNFALPNFLFTFFLGIVWGYISQWTGSFFNTWPIHFINNLFFIFFLGYNQFYFPNLAIFNMKNLPNNFIWLIIFFCVNLIWLYRTRNLVMKETK